MGTPTPTNRQSEAANRRAPGPRSDSLADILERVLDSGVVVAGDIRVQLADIELLTIQLRLIVCSVERAEELGMDWWRDADWLESSDGEGSQQRSPEDQRTDPAVEGTRHPAKSGGASGSTEASVEERLDRMEQSLQRLEDVLGEGDRALEPAPGEEGS